MTENEKAMEEELVISLMLSEPRIERLTEPVIEKALDGFALEPVKDWAWMARAVRVAVYCGMRLGIAPDRVGNVKVKRELSRLSKQASKLWLNLFNMSHAAKDALWDFDFHNWVDSPPGEIREGELMGQSAEQRAYRELVDRLNWLSAYLNSAAQHVGSKKQATRWRDGERRERRIYLAMCLSWVFERAYDRQPTVNKWPDGSKRRSLGPWADFYQRIMAVALNEHTVPDLEGVLVRARGEVLKAPVIFPPGMMPE